MNRRIVPILVLLAGLAMAFHPTLLSGFSRLQTDLGDTRLNNYLLEHGWRWLSGDGGVRLWHPPFFYPAPNVLAYGDLLLSFGPLYWPWRALGLGEVLSFQLWMIGIAVCNYAVCFLFLRRVLHFDQPGASLGAFVISFAASRTGQLGHQQMIPIVFVVGALWAVRSMVQTSISGVARGRERWAPFALAGCLLAQLYGSYYNLAFSLAILTVAVLSALIVPSWRRVLLGVVSVHWRATVAAGCLAFAIALPAALHYLEAAGMLQSRPPQAAFRALPRLASWAYVDEGSWWYGWMNELHLFRGLPARNEHALGLGFLTTACLLWAAWRNRTQPAVRLAIMVAIVLALLVTMFPGGIQLWTVLYRVFPPFQGLRAVGRIGMLLAIPAGIAVAWMVTQRGHSARATLVTALAVLACLEQGVTTRSIEVATVKARADELAAEVDPSADAFLFVPQGPVRGGWPRYQLDAMWASRRTGVATINGYSGNRPPGWEFGELRIRRGERLDEVRRRLGSWAGTMGLDPSRIQVVVVDVEAHFPPDERPRAKPLTPPRRGGSGRPPAERGRTPIP